MHVTLVLLLTIFLQLSQADICLYLCSRPPYQDKVITHGTKECCEWERMSVQQDYREFGLRVNLITGAAKHKWKIIRTRNLQETPVENISLTMYRVTDDSEMWLPLEGCIDIPLQDEECFPTKCDDLYDRRVILRKGNKSYVDPMAYSRICEGHKCKNTTIDIKILNFTLTSFLELKRDQKQDEVTRHQLAQNLKESAEKCYFYFDKGRVNKLAGNFSKGYSDHYNRKVFVLSSEVNVFYVNYQKEYVLDLTTCSIHRCKIIPKSNSSIEGIENYEFPTSNNSNSLVCVPTSLSSNKADIVCMEPKRTKRNQTVSTMSTTTTRSPGPVDGNLIRQILISIFIALGIVLVIISVACCASWQRTQRKLKEDEKMKHEEFKIDFGVKHKYLSSLSDEEASGDIPIPLDISDSLLMKSYRGGEDGNYLSNSSLYLRSNTFEEESLETIHDSNNELTSTRIDLGTSSDSEEEDDLLGDGYTVRISSEKD